MKVIKTEEIENKRKVVFHAGVSNRIILKEDCMGFSFTKTVISPEAGKVFQHYKNHLESCYCIKGKAILTCAESGEEFLIEPDTTYILDKNDPHFFEAIEETVLLCVFNPPLVGNEIHKKDGSYEKDELKCKDLGFMGMHP